MRVVPASKGKKGFHFYAAKDQRMAEEASVGLMVWDGKSVGTLTNVLRLVRRRKKGQPPVPFSVVEIIKLNFICVNFCHLYIDLLKNRRIFRIDEIRSLKYHGLIT